MGLRTLGGGGRRPRAHDDDIGSGGASLCPNSCNVCEPSTCGPAENRNAPTREAAMKNSATVLIRLIAFLLCSSPVATLALGSPDMDDPPPFDCSQIVASGIGKQVNIRAGRM